MPVLDPVDFNLFFCWLLYFTVKPDRPLVFCGEILPSLGICGQIKPSLGVLQQDLTAPWYFATRFDRPLAFCSKIRLPLMVYGKIQPFVAIFRLVFKKIK
jgi:hypothetical protein